MTSLLETKKSIEGILLLREDVIGVGIDDDKQTIRVYVNREGIVKELPELPPFMSGFPLEIIPIPGFAPVSGSAFRSNRYRPVVGGVSASHTRVTAGTVGAVVVDKLSGRKLLLSNNHVFANADSIENKRANEGDLIIQPGVVDGGTLDDAVATLYRWIPFSDDKLNLVDAALALPLDQNMVSPYVLMNSHNDLVQIRGVKSVTSPIMVKKYSRTTDADRGRVVDWNFTVAVDYEDGTTRNFTDQILAEIETQGGDSGSILLDENNYAVGLVFAGGMDTNGKWFGVANKIRNVLAMFGDDVDVSDGFTETSVTEPKPNFIIEDVSFGLRQMSDVGSEIIDRSNQLGINIAILMAGAFAVTMLIRKSLNKGK